MINPMEKRKAEQGKRDWEQRNRDQVAILAQSQYAQLRN